MTTTPAPAATTDTPPPHTRHAPTLDALTGAMFEMTRWPGLSGSERCVYLVLAIRPALGKELLADVVGRAESTLRAIESRLARQRLFDPVTRTVLYPRTGQPA